MDVETFDEIFFRFQTQFDAVSDHVDIEIPVEHSTVDQILPDDFLETKDSDIAADVTCARFPTVSAVPIFPSQITAGAASFVPIPKWSGQLQAVTSDVLLQQPTSVNSTSWGSGTTSVSTPRASRRKSIKPHDSVHKHIGGTQFYSNRLTRPPNREEHTLRERKRRNDMAEKFLLLEKLLPPPQASRQKVEIVEDTIKLVKRLRLRKDELVRRSAKLKLKVLNQNRLSMKPQLMQIMSPLESSTLELVRKPTLDTPGMPMTIGQSTLQFNYPNSADATVTHMTPPRVDTISSCRNLLQIHARVSDDEILVEMLFRQYSPNLHARVVQTVETMKLELIHGSMQRSMPGSQFIKCIITAIESRVDQCQSRRHQDTPSSARLLVAALQAAFGV